MANNGPIREFVRNGKRYVWVQNRTLPAQPSPAQSEQFRTRPEGQIYGPPEGWDYRTARTGFEGEELPEGAIGWGPDGEPYYGYGALPIIGNVAEWGLRAWNNINRPTEGPLQEQPKAVAFIRSLGEGKTEEEAGQKPTAMQIAARAPGELFRGLGEALSAPARAVEQGAWGIAQAGRDVEESPLPDITGKIEETLPEAKGIEGWEWTNRGFLSEANKAAREAYFTIMPPFAAYNTLRFLTAPLSIGEKRDILNDNIAAARIAYSAWTDPALREEFIRRYHAGEDPYLLELELARPGAELVGQFIFDPLWLAGGWISKPSRASKLARGASVPEELRPFLKAIADADEVSKAEKIVEFNKARAAYVASRGEKMTGMTKQVGLFRLNAQGKRYVTMGRIDDVLEFIFGSNRNTPEGALDLLEALVRSVSDDEAEAAAGVARLLKDEGLANIWLSEDATDTALFLRRMIENEDGAVDAAAFLNKVNSAQTVDEQLKLAKAAVDGAMAGAFPTVTEMTRAAEQAAKLLEEGKAVPAHLQRAAEAAEELSSYQRALAAFDSVAQSKFYQPVNKFFSTIYMGYNPGYAFRNMFTNYFHMFIDEPGSVTKSAWSILSGHPNGAVGRAEESALKWLGGIRPTSLEQGLTQTKGVVQGAKATGPTAALSDAFERNAGAAVYSRSVEKSMRAMLQPGRALPAMTDLVNAGMDPHAAAYLAKLVVDNYGDVGAAAKAFRAALGTGEIDAWRTMSWVDPNLKKFMEAMYGGGDSLWATVQRALAEVQTPEDVRGAIKSILEAYRHEAAKAGKEAVGVHIAQETMDAASRALIISLSEMTGASEKEAEALLMAIKQADHLAVTKYIESIAQTGPEGARVAEVLIARWEQSHDESAKLTKAAMDEWDKMLAAAKAEGRTLKKSPEAAAFWRRHHEQLLNNWRSAVNEIGMAAEQYAGELKLAGNANIDRGLFDARNLLRQSDLWHNARWENGRWVADGLKKGEKLIAPAPDFMAASPARTVAEMLPDIEKALMGLEKGILDQWGNKLPVMSNPAQEAALKAWEKEAAGRVTEARWLAKKVADEQRKFTLLSYPEKKGIDTVLGYLFPYQFWYSRTYVNWMKRLADNPVILSHYAKYRRTLEQLHAGAPDWWKYNINTNELLGLDAENPLFFNLEATLNPLNGLTGVDFNDPQKRGTWYENFLDDIGKFGPTVWTPYATALAVAAYMRGDEEAAARWGGRLFPQTATAKSFLGLLRHKVSDLPLQGEYDPFVHLFSGGLDPYERNRVGRALGQLVDEKQIDAATARDAAYTHSGPAWDMALDLAVNNRAAGQLSSQMLGVGFKARSQSDLEVDKFWSDYGRLWTMEPNLSPEEFKQGMSELKKTYPFMDAVLISRKNSLARDRAYAYSVMGDIPPSMGDDFAQWAGIPRELWSKFYDDKGALDTWSVSDRERFMAGIIDIAAVVDVPDEATRDEWLQAKNRYQRVMDAEKQMFGDDIGERIDTYYGAKGDTPEDQARADAILAADPEIQQALNFRAQMVTNDPILFPYYASMSQIERYWKGFIYSDVEKKAGMPYAQISQSWEEYFKQLPGAERRAYWNEHPELQIYVDVRDAWLPIVNQKIVEFGSKLRDVPVQIREQAGEPSFGQQSVLYGIENQQRGFPQLSWQEWQGVLGDSLARIVLDNAVLGDDLPKSAQGRLDDIAEEMGLPSGDAVLMLAVQSVQAP